MLAQSSLLFRRPSLPARSAAWCGQWSRLTCSPHVRDRAAGAEQRGPHMFMTEQRGAQGCIAPRACRASRPAMVCRARRGNSPEPEVGIQNKEVGQCWVCRSAHQCASLPPAAAPRGSGPELTTQTVCPLFAQLLVGDALCLLCFALWKQVGGAPLRWRRMLASACGGRAALREHLGSGAGTPAHCPNPAAAAATDKRHRAAALLPRLACAAPLQPAPV